MDASDRGANDARPELHRYFSGVASCFASSRRPSCFATVGVPGRYERLGIGKRHYALRGMPYMRDGQRGLWSLRVEIANQRAVTGRARLPKQRHIVILAVRHAPAIARLDALVLGLLWHWVRTP